MVRLYAVTVTGDPVSTQAIKNVAGPDDTTQCILGDPDTSVIETDNTLWVVMAGMADSNQITLKPLNPLYESKALTHASYLLYTKERTELNTLSTWQEDATYKVVDALYGADQGYISLESYNFPGYYIRHESWKMKIDNSLTTDTQKQDASWRVEKVSFVAGTQGTNVCPSGSSKITTRAVCEAAAAFAGTVFTAVLGGVWNTAGSPTGCFLALNGEFVLNTHPIGAPYPADTPYCVL